MPLIFVTSLAIVTFLFYWKNDDDNQLLLPYDGRMYEQLLTRYQDKIQLVEAQLISEFLLKNLVKN